jgi:glycosyltransferase involved in cell wall biosynthesis
LLHESFASADAFLVSLEPGLEGYIVPSKLYGILAAGRPFIAAVDPSCEVATIATQHGCGLVAPPGDLNALVKTIATLADDPASAAKMGENARRASWTYDRRASVRTYYELFASLCHVTTTPSAA